MTPYPSSRGPANSGWRRGDGFPRACHRELQSAMCAETEKMRAEHRKPATRQSPEPKTIGDELRETGSGQSPATPAWALLFVAGAVATLFVVALTVVTISYALS